MYRKEFEIRWSDVDANRHLANSAYLNYTSHTRIAFLLELGLDQKSFTRLQMGPVAFYEHLYYFKEVLPGRPIQVSMEVVGMSEDGKFFEFKHDFYNHQGENVARSEMMGAWMDLKTRRLTVPPKEFIDALNAMDKQSGFRVLTKADTRKLARVPKHLNSGF